MVRALVGVWLAFHTAVIAAAPIADALTDRAGAIVAHWDDVGQRNCPPLHDSAVCGICQAVSATFGGAVVPGLAPARLVLAEVAPPESVGSAAHVVSLRGSPEPRGPPTV